MSFFKKLFGKSKADKPKGAVVHEVRKQPPMIPLTAKSSKATQVTFKREGRSRHPMDRNTETITKTYSAQNREAAVDFLRKQTITESYVYVEVVTPSGIFGVDRMGKIYDSGGELPGDSSELLEKPTPTTNRDPSQLDASKWKALSQTIYDAASSGDLQRMEAMLKEHSNLVFARAGTWGAGPLHAAARKGHKEVTVLLLEKGADVNVADQDGETPLHEAATNGQTKVVELLLAKGADIHAKAEYELTPLHRAASEGHKDVVALLLAKGADIHAKADEEGGGMAPLHKAAEKGHKDVVALLLANNADVNAKGEWEGPLGRAAAEGHKDVVALLLANKADVNATGAWGTPLYRAAQRGHKDVVELLREQGGHE